MKQIVITFSDRAWRQLQQAVVVRAMSGGLHGTVDEFAAGVVERVRRGDWDWHVRVREDLEDEKEVMPE